MAKNSATQAASYSVNILEDPDTNGALRFTFVPKAVRPTSTEKATVEAMPQYIVSVQNHANETNFKWINRPVQESTQRELEAAARQKISIRLEWLEKLRKLVATVKNWAQELDWATKTVDKKIEDAELGNYKAPGLLLQHETVRLFLEPIARTAPGAEGVVDLYLMPSYDDIANLYFYNNRWHIHYLFKRASNNGKAREEEAKPLTKESLRKVFDEMKAHAE
ncbi:hypothetical protein KIH39_21985 [Telmatocola sphagniphila]|uniref:Uncharacterized protein n=1 Tax=Telmatocola sphagniphila TaxID=1123043 RepID=A0A8E6B6K8_9BACT|nr:hypothetical protein [Telmatocola sphagniphila]QVL31488.1 hypothetical protein KIH39_21985 [Telmatocola sphagniphila]